MYAVAQFPVNQLKTWIDEAVSATKKAVRRPPYGC